jgi:amidase
MAPLGDCLSGLATSGPLGRTVADVAALLDVMAGYVVGDPYWLPDPAQPFRHSPLPRSPQRIALVQAIAPIGRPHPDCTAAVDHIAQALESLGHHLDPIDLDCSALVEPFQVVWRGGVKATQIPMAALEPVNQWLFQQPDSSGDYQNAVWAMQIAARQMVAQLANYDAVLMPTLMAPPIAVGAWAHLSPDALMQNVIRWVAPCPLANATGLPAIALPALQTSAGLPVGVQLVGRPADEAKLLGLAYQLEAGGAWPSSRPPLAL